MSFLAVTLTIRRSQHKPISGTLHESLVPPLKHEWTYGNDEENDRIEEPEEGPLS